MRRPRSIRATLAALTLSAAALLPACGVYTTRSYALNSTTTGAQLAPRMTTAAFVQRGPVSADVILTDLPTAALRPGGSLEGLTGNLVLIRMFMKPRPGRTPIEDTAFNTSITHAVLSDGRVGVYRGGGFILPTVNFSDSRFTGRFLGGHVRLESSTGGFADLLQTATLRAGVTAPADPGLVELAKDRLDEIIDATTPIDPEYASN